MLFVYYPFSLESLEFYFDSILKLGLKKFIFFSEPKASTIKNLPINKAPTEKEIVEKALVENTPTKLVEHEAGIFKIILRMHSY